MTYPMYLNPDDPSGRTSNPMTTGQKVGVGATVLAVGTVSFFIGRHLGKGKPVVASTDSGPVANP